MSTQYYPQIYSLEDLSRIAFSNTYAKNVTEQTKEEREVSAKFTHDFSILEANHVWLSSMPKTQLYKRNAADALLFTPL